MNSRTPLALAMLVAITQFGGVAYAQPPKATAAIREDKAQMSADQAALAQERAQLKADQKALKADTRSGRMAAESPDAERVYQDQRAIKGQENAIANDKAKLRADRRK